MHKVLVAGWRSYNIKSMYMQFNEHLEKDH